MTSDTRMDPEAQSLKEESMDNGLKRSFQPMHAVHFSELAKIWEEDRRMPTHPSRRAWADARNLNLVNVNRWWYRRKVVAKKLRIKIPQGTYELEVGVPPRIPTPEPVLVKDEPCTEADLSSTAHSRSSTDLDAPNSDVLTDSSHTSYSNWDAIIGTSLKGANECAYMRSPSSIRDDLTSCSPLLFNSSRQPSSLPSSSPPPCLQSCAYPCTSDEDLCISYPLFLPPDISTDDIDSAVLDTQIDITRSELPCSSTFYTPWSLSHEWLSPEPIRSVEPRPLPLTFDTWCFSGYRVACDGSLLGKCACSDMVHF